MNQFELFRYNVELYFRRSVAWDERLAALATMQLVVASAAKRLDGLGGGDGSFSRSQLRWEDARDLVALLVQERELGKDIVARVERIRLHLVEAVK